MELAARVLDRMTQHTAVTRRKALEIINEWADEAEAEYETMVLSSGINTPNYYEFIRDFADGKMKSFERKLNEKSAKLVTFYITTRVCVSNSDQDVEFEDEAIRKAIGKILEHPSEYICYDNVDWVEPDTECPFGTFGDDFAK